MGRPAKHDKVKDQKTGQLSDQPNLTADQRELLDSLHKSFQQAERGETRPAREFLEEWRLEREAEENASRNGA